MKVIHVLEANLMRMICDPSISEKDIEHYTESWKEMYTGAQDHRVNTDRYKNWLNLEMTGDYVVEASPISSELDRLFIWNEDHEWFYVRTIDTDNPKCRVRKFIENIQNGVDLMTGVEEDPNDPFSWGWDSKSLPVNPEDTVFFPEVTVWSKRQ